MRTVSVSGQDIGVAVRSLRKAPVYTGIAIASLALAIGANTAIFSLIDAALLRPLPSISRPDRLASLYNQNTRNPDALSSSSWRDYEYYRDQNHVFSGLMAYLRLPMPLRTGERTENISGELVSFNYFQVLGAKAQIGRTFAPSDNPAPGGAPLAVISDRLWRERFDGSPQAVGRTLMVGGQPFTVIGVAPREFRGVVLDWGQPPQFWIPMTMYREAVPAFARYDALRLWGMHSMLVTGRLRDGVTVAQAAAEMRALSVRIDMDHPDRALQWQKAGLAWTVRTVPLAEARFWPGFRNQVVRVVVVLLAVVAGVLLIACANVASLMLTRAAERQKELAARLALGAGAWRIARLLLVESLMIAFAGGAAGLLVAVLVVRILSSFPRLFAVPLTLDLGVDLRALLFTFAVTTLSGIGFGLAPLRRALRTDLISALRAGAPSAHPRSRGFGLRGALLVTQMSLTLVLLVGAGLFLSTFQNAAASDPFLRAGNLLLMEIDVGSAGTGEAVRTAFFAELPDRVRAVPGVRSAGLAFVLPLSGMRMASDIDVLEPASGAGPLGANVDVNVISPGYFETTGSPVVQGRDFDSKDRSGAAGVAMVNEQMARQFWGGDAIGRRIRHEKQVLTVVGVTRDGSRRNYRRPVSPCLYLPAAQKSMYSMSLVLRTEGNPISVLPAVRDTVAALSPAAVMNHPQTLSSYANIVLAQERLAAWCLGALAVLSLTLSSVGLYGAISFSVSRRTAEIGVRMALGARPGQIVRMVASGVGKIAVAGIVSGSLAAFFLARYARSLLYGVTEREPVTWVAGALVLCLAALAAGVAPALKAARIDPATALRSE